MNATIALPTTVVRPCPGTSIVPRRSLHGSGPRAFAASLALTTVVLTAVAGGLLGGAGTAGPASCVPRPVPGGGWAAADCAAHPTPGSDIVVIIPR